MEAFASYLIRSAVWLSAFAVIYFIFLRNERFFMLKRVYLIAGILVSFIFPLITVHYQVEVPVPVPPPFNPVPALSQPASVVKQAVEIDTFNYKYIIAGIYLAGMIFMIARSIWNFRHLFKTIHRSVINNRGPAKLIRASEYTSSFSFFNYVFVNPSISGKEVEEIMNHELVHVRQKHWFDLLLGEMLMFLQWANPLAWIYTGFIRLNHEYLADEVALQRSSDPAVYKAALLNQMFNAPVIRLSNSFNYSLNKKRFDMMKKIFTSPYRKLKVLFVIPVFAIVFYAFATPEYHYFVASESPMEIYQSPALTQQPVKGEVLKEDGSPLSGVTIVVSGTSIGAITDATGKFTLADVPADAIMTFSCAGYKTQSVKAKLGMPMVMHLQKDPAYKEDLKIVGYGDGTPLTKPVTVIRTSDGLPADVLVIVDGVQGDQNSLKALDPNTIKSLSVLKDQSAVAVFGEKGRKGVIIVTTKKDSGSSQQLQTQNVFAQRPQPLVVIDGVISEKNLTEARKDLGYNMGIARSVMGKEATDKYGEKGANGVVEITTREKALAQGLKPPFPRLAPEDYPTFQGQRFSTFNDWVAGQVKYPAEAQAKKVEGWVSVNFKVELDGSISNVVSTIPVDPLLSDEVIRVINASAKWDPPKNTNVDEPLTQGVTLKFKLPDQIIKEAPFVVVEKMPLYPGGDVALLNTIKANLRYPESARAEKIEGRVILRFVVSSEGKTEAISILKGVHPLLDAEAIRIAGTLTGWNPGMQFGKAVNVWYMAPVTFSLNPPEPLK